jgi:hypothetical protein
MSGVGLFRRHDRAARRRRRIASQRLKLFAMSTTTTRRRHHWTGPFGLTATLVALLALAVGLMQPGDAQEADTGSADSPAAPEADAEPAADADGAAQPGPIRFRFATGGSVDFAVRGETATTAELRGPDPKTIVAHATTTTLMRATTTAAERGDATLEFSIHRLAQTYSDGETTMSAVLGDDMGTDGEGGLTAEINGAPQKPQSWDFWPIGDHQTTLPPSFGVPLARAFVPAAGGVRGLMTLFPQRNRDHSIAYYQNPGDLAALLFVALPPGADATGWTYRLPLPLAWSPAAETVDLPLRRGAGGDAGIVVIESARAVTIATGDGRELTLSLRGEFGRDAGQFRELRYTITERSRSEMLTMVSDSTLRFSIGDAVAPPADETDPGDETEPAGDADAADGADSGAE